MEKELKKKIESWSLGKNNYKMIPAGGEILKSIGSEMLFIEFSRDTEGNWTTKDPQPIFIQGIGGYNPLTGTYEIKYSGKDKTVKTETITPEGFSFNDPDKEGWMHRFVTYSLHFKMMEEELYYNRLRTKYDKSENVLPIDSIIVLQKGKQEESLKYHNYIAAVIDTDVEGGLGQGILSFRIGGITKIDKRSKSWSFGLRDTTGYYMAIPKYQELEGTWICKNFSISGVILGDLKIIDIEDPKA
jgi:hypothetical protein